MLEVAVIGAGASGLVAARQLLMHDIRPFILEASSTVGGAWSSSSSSSAVGSSSRGSSRSTNVVGKGQYDRTPTSPATPTSTSTTTTSGRMWNGLHTNLSKHTCRFSDLPFPTETETFPSAADMDKYLQKYASTFLLFSDEQQVQLQQQLPSDLDSHPKLNDRTTTASSSSSSPSSDQSSPYFHFNCQVTKVSPLFDVVDYHNFEDPGQVATGGGGGGGGGASGSKDDDDSSFLHQYSVEWTCLETLEKHKRDFDGVIVASGFFNQPYYPPNIFVVPSNEKNYDDDDGDDDDGQPIHDDDDRIHNLHRQQKKKIQVIHSHDYNNHQTGKDDVDVNVDGGHVIEDGVSESKNGVSDREKNDMDDTGNSSTTASDVVAVVGSSFSALEIAVDVSRNPKTKRVVSILPTVPWILPRYIPSTTTTTTTVPTADGDGGGDGGGSASASSPYLLPIDLAFYQRPVSFRNGTESNEQIILTEEQCIERHKSLRDIVGDRQLDTLGRIPNDFSKPPYVAISDRFLDLVKDGTIDVVFGRLDHIDDSTGVHVLQPILEGIGTASKNEENEQHQKRILSDVTKVICCTGYKPNLQDFLDESILEAIAYNSNDLFSPTTLCWETIHPSLPNFGFCGMYRGPYMGVMEQQAKLVAGSIAGIYKPTNQEYSSALSVSKEILSQASSSSRPQFPRHDYIGFMDTLSARVMKSPPRWNTQKGDIISPAFYHGGSVNDDDTQKQDEIAQAAIQDMNAEIQKAKDGYKIPEAVLSALIGKWDFHRDIVHFSNGHHEVVTGTITYSRDKSLQHVKYREDGLYKLSETKSIEVFREYEYECQEYGDLLEVFFVEYGKRAHLFLSLKFQPQGEDGSNNYWVATSDHLCIKDLYKGTFQIKMDGLKATELTISYRVKGPEKDYEATTYMSPQSSTTNQSYGPRTSKSQ